MINNNHPITPPLELIYQWVKEVCPEYGKGVHLIEEHVATQAARWGADQELDACCEWMAKRFGEESHAMGLLRAARRPNSLSLKERSIALIDKIQANEEMWQTDELDVVRRAIESLPD